MKGKSKKVEEMKQVYVYVYEFFVLIWRVVAFRNFTKTVQLKRNKLDKEIEKSFSANYYGH